MDDTDKISFNCLHLQTHVTCIEIIDNRVFAGIGGYLTIFNANNNILVKKQKVFKNDVIFGIKPSLQLNKLIVYGQKSIIVIPFRGDILEQPEAEEHYLTDWIMCSQWIDNDTQFVTMSMHNEVTLWAQDFCSQTSVICAVKCLLYSAYICFNSWKELLVFSGTVFNEILLWKPFNVNSGNGLSPVLMTLQKHNGVIFCIDVDLTRRLICTSSDDRSAVLWKLTYPDTLSNITAGKSDQLQITPECQVYGHTSRVFKCLILQNFFATAGEDSFIILWTFGGDLIRKIDSHQSSTVWALGYNETTGCLYSGGSDGGLVKFKCNCANEHIVVQLPAKEQPKHVAILYSGSMLCISEGGTLYQEYQSTFQQASSAKHPDLKKYCLLQVSPCKKLVALAGFEGQIYIYRDGNGNGTVQLVHRHFLKWRSRIVSFHWLDCKRFVVQQGNIITLNFIHQRAVHVAGIFALPTGPKGRFITCACSWNKHVIIGDNIGHIYNYVLGIRLPVNMIRKAHNHLGVTQLYVDRNRVISLGKNGFIKDYDIDEVSGDLKCNKSHRTKFGWLTALECSHYILSFSGNTFKVSDVKSGVLVEIVCGGGHRSWDYSLNHLTGSMVFSFVKQKVIKKITFDINSYKPNKLIQGYHNRTINCLKLLPLGEFLLMVSGGEDTMLRIITIGSNNSFRILECLKVHLSSIRVLHLHQIESCKDQLLISGGGRAQIICWHLQVSTETQVSCTEKYNFYEPLSRDESETRIMDLNTARLDNQLLLFAGCSTGFIKVFTILNDLSLVYQKSVLHSPHSITKLASITQYQLLTSMATDGTLAFWAVSEGYPSEPLCSYAVHESGINSFSCLLQENKLTVLTGGDDNCVTLSLFLVHQLNNNCNGIDISRLHQLQNKSIHCAQITGAFLSEDYAITSSIDQRVVLSKWTCLANHMRMTTLATYSTAVTDLQGLEGTLGQRLCVYGEGFEILEVNVPIRLSKANDRCV